MKILNILIIVLSLFISCDSNNIEKAYEILNKARQASSSKDYDKARILIDSLRQTYPEAISVRRAALLFADSVELNEAKTELEIADSICTYKGFEVEDIKKSFVFEKDKNFQTIGFYVVPKHAGSKASLSFFPEVEEKGKLLYVTIDKQRNYIFKEVFVSDSCRLEYLEGVPSECHEAAEMCYKLALLMHQFSIAKEQKEKLELKVRFYEKKIKEAR